MWWGGRERESEREGVSERGETIDRQSRNICAFILPHKFIYIFPFVDYKT